MNVDATEQQIDDVRTALEDDPQIKTFRFFNKEDALEEFKRIFRKDPDLVKNITPRRCRRRSGSCPSEAEFTDDDQAALRDRIAGVDQVSTPAEALEGLLERHQHRPADLHRALGRCCSSSSLFLIVNTIRLATFARRREIEVMKLVGASNWFVRVPFMAEGLVQGLIGAGLAVVSVLALKQFIFDGPLADAGDFFRDFFVTGGDSFQIAVYVLVLGVIIGLIGSTIGLRRFLRV